MRKCLTLFIFSNYFQLCLVQFTNEYFRNNPVWEEISENDKHTQTKIYINFMK